ncbi:hypothetical protein C8Q79DRAFT_1013484 [Trametes meyenii]|nr:hypothetical protein C8Q79DRAFT_1013484 [Trametes meyenii]
MFTPMKAVKFKLPPVILPPESPPSHPEPCKAAEPFDRDDADFVLRSSDQVDFHVHRVILTMASSVFETMLTLPQPEGNTKIERPLVDVSEDSETLDVLLRVCYPTSAPELRDIPLLRKVLEAANKYDIPAVLTLVKKAMVQPELLDSDPLRIFVIACRFGMEPEAQAAAKKTALRNFVVGSVQVCPELEDISAGAYYRLLQLQLSKNNHPFKKPALLKHPAADVSANEPFCEPANRKVAPTRTPLESVGYPFDAPDADLILRSSDGIEFRVSRTVMTLASPAFLGRTLASCDEDAENKGGPVHVMAEDSVVVDALLRSCYPTGYQAIEDLDLILDVLLAAKKYEIKRSQQMIQSIFPRMVEKDPLRLYFAAARCGWAKEARLCAVALLRIHGVTSVYTRYIPEMEQTSNGIYLRLLAFADSCSKAASRNHELSVRLHPKCPKRLCAPILATDSVCQTRYPSVVFTGLTPSWLTATFASLNTALKEKPSRAILTNTSVARALVSVVANDSPPCTSQAKPAGEQDSFVISGRKCSAGDNVLWAYALLDSFAQRVDEALAKVQLQVEPLA